MIMKPEVIMFNLTDIISSTTVVILRSLDVFHCARIMACLVCFSVL